MIDLTLPELIHIAERALGGEVLVRDYGLLQSVLSRPGATVFGAEAYPKLAEKAPALLHSLARNHALVEGNKRLALAATITFLGINGRRLTLSNDQADELVMAISAGELEDIATIGARVEQGSQPW